MKFVRFGEPGRERPGVGDQQGRIRDVSSGKAKSNEFFCGS
jgi:hypothetical protein